MFTNKMAAMNPEAKPTLTSAKPGFTEEHILIVVGSFTLYELHALNSQHLQDCVFNSNSGFGVPCPCVHPPYLS